MEIIIQIPGLQYITEMILLNLDLENLQTCQLLSKSAGMSWTMQCFGSKY